jgi:NAD(P)H-hydrate epimerase
MKVFSAKQMRELDAFTIQAEGISSIDLMEHASREVALSIMSRWSFKVPFVVFAGSGNNGGDALAVSRLLLEVDYNVKTFLINPHGKLSPDCSVNKERLRNMPNAEFIEITDELDFPPITQDTVILDGIFGTGLNKPVTGIFAQVVEAINASSVQVVSIDMPSGLMCENNQNNNPNHIVRASLTLTFQNPKLSQLMDENYQFVGELQILDIGLSKSYSDQLFTPYQLIDSHLVRSLRRRRSPIGHKGTFGHALLVAGKYKAEITAHDQSIVFVPWVLILLTDGFQSFFLCMKVTCYVDHRADPFRLTCCSLFQSSCYHIFFRLSPTAFISRFPRTAFPWLRGTELSGEFLEAPLL